MLEILNPRTSANVVKTEDIVIVGIYLFFESLRGFEMFYFNFQRKIKLYFLIHTNILCFLNYLFFKFQVIIDNSLLAVTIAKPGGFVSGIKYNGMDNILDEQNPEDDRGYVFFIPSQSKLLHFDFCILTY